MKKKKLLNLSAIVLGALMCFGFGKVQATDSIFSDVELTRENLKTVATENAMQEATTVMSSRSKTLKLIDSGYSTQENSGKKIWKVVNPANGEEIYYCLSRNQGFRGMAENQEDEYPTSLEMTRDNLNTYSTKTLSQENYNKVLWILSTDISDYATLMKNAGISIYSDNTYNLTQEDITIAQRLAIWHFTDGFNAIDGIGGIPSNDLKDYDGDIITRSRQYKLKQLYNYFVSNASAQNNSVTRTLKLEKPNAKVEESGNYFVAGPFKLTKNNVSVNSLQVLLNNSAISDYLVVDSKTSTKNITDYSNLNNFYVKILKSKVTASSTLKITVDGSYNEKIITLLTDASDKENTQPIAIVEDVTKPINTNSTIDINLTGSYDVVLVKEDENGEQLNSTATFEVNGTSKTVTGRLIIADDVQITKNNVGTADVYTIKETKAPDEYCEFDGTITVTVTKAVKDGKYIASNVAYEVTNEDKENVKVYLKDGNIYVEVINYPEEKEADLALRKFITKVGSTNITDRKPEVGNWELDNGTTVTKKHTKDPITVKTGDIVTYTIRVYNEGQVDAKATRVTDYLPAGLEFVENNATNTKYGWKTGTKVNGMTEVYTDYLKNKTINAYSENNGLKYEDLQIVCRVTKEASDSNISLKNIAEITEATDTQGNPLTDRDSEPGNVNASDSYNPTNPTTGRGEQDDDDFEELVILPIEEKPDLALRKYITKVDSTDIKDRIPEINTTNLENESATTAKYVHKKDVVEVKAGSEVIYNITIYNEGKVDARASKITDQIPAGLEFVEVVSGNYEMESYNTTTNRLVLKETSSNQSLQAYVSGDLDSTTVQVKCKVLETAEENKNLTNVAWISEMKDKDGNVADNDRDSSPNTSPDFNKNNMASYEGTENDNGYYKGEQDDDDFDRVIIKPVEVTGSYNVVLKKVDQDGKSLTGATIKVNGKTYTVGTATITSNVAINSTSDITLEYALEEIKAPNGYLGLSTNKNITLKLEVEKVSKVYNIKRAYLVDENGDRTTDNDISLELSNNTITMKIKNTPVQKEFDFALRKFITKVNDTEVNREPKVDTSTISTTGTARYVHSKDPVAVQVGDIVAYKMRVYNEGETDGYVSKITDHLPEWLDFLPENETNQKYLWSMEDNRTISTEIAKKDSITGEEVYAGRTNKQLLSAYNGGSTLDYIDVEIVCQVNDKAPVKRLMTNIADITGMQDTEGTDIITDRDSSKENVVLPSDKNLPNYEGTENDNGYYRGQEDDDDFEKIIVEKFDLSLRKFITEIGPQTYDREPIVDTSSLGVGDTTTAIYTHSKDPINVKKGDIITYIIRIYNEGTIAGYANEVVDYIPEGLTFIENSSINKEYGWVVDGDKIKTTYLSDNNSNNVINPVTEDAEGNKTLSYKDLKVQFEVTADPKEYVGDIITNWAEISEDSNNDIDSTPDRIYGNDKEDEDDIDYEPVKLTYFDLALRKFITKVNDIDYNNRVPSVDTSRLGTVDESGKKITTATYTHTKDPVILETGSTVVYTLRAYNEGTIAGYANEITDNIPEGLEFLPENEVNTKYKWIMLDENGEMTEDVSKAVKITTNYLSENNGTNNVLSAYQTNNGVIALDYKDVKVAFKVTQPNTSDRIIVNTAEISKASEEDIDSTPGNDELTEDDIDREYVKVQTFDLALKKWVTATKVTYNGKTKTTKTGFNENSTGIAKVDLVGKRLKKTTVKFVYNIKVINEGQVAGYAYEVKDYIPSGLKFVAADNPKWTLQKDGTVTTDQLKDTLLQPGESATVEIVLTWKNSSSNMGVKTNWAEISKDSGDDIDSTPDNNVKGEDDIDNAKVILSIKTGTPTTYIVLILGSVAILGSGTFFIKKYVMNQ